MKRFAALHDWPVLSRRASTRPTPPHRVVRREQDERVGSAELERDLLQVAARDLGDRGTGPLRSGDRHALHAPVGDHRRRLVIGRVDIRVLALGEAGVPVDLLIAAEDSGHCERA